MFSAENEQCVIGALLIDNDAIDFIGNLTAEHFFVEDHRLLFTTIVRMITAGRGCDAVTLAEELLDRNDGENWLVIVGDMVANTPGTKNIARYAKIVIDRATDRALLAASNEISHLAASKQPTDEKVDAAQGLVMALADNRGQKEGRRIDSILNDVVDRVMAGEAGKIVRHLTHYRDIDARCDMLTPGDLIVIAGRPSMGKTTFAMNLAEAVCQEDGRKAVVVFSQEMGDTQLGVKMVSSIGRIDLNRLTRDYHLLDAEDFDRMSVAVHKTSGFNLHVDDQPARNLHQVRSYCRSVRRKHGELGLVVVDYLQLMQGEGDTRAEQIGSISRGLKSIAKELQVPVIALSQLNRSLESRPNKRPVMSDLRESGQIEQDADVIAFIYRDEVYHPDTPDKGTAEIIFGKVRMGEIGTARLAFFGQFSRFDNLLHAWSPPPPKEPAKRKGFA
jgi:replicative DNA helicase